MLGQTDRIKLHSDLNFVKATLPSVGGLLAIRVVWAAWLFVGRGSGDGVEGAGVTERNQEKGGGSMGGSDRLNVPAIDTFGH